MEFMRVKAKDLKVVMFTSSNPGAGKTFVSMNLAMSFVLTNKKVILVDTDIRKGTTEQTGYPLYLSLNVPSCSSSTVPKEYPKEPPSPTHRLLKEPASIWVPLVSRYPVPDR